MATEVGRVSIRVVPNTEGFRDDVEREVAKLRDIEIEVEADLDTEKAKAEAEKFEKTTKPKVTADIDAAKLKSKLKAATKELRETVRVAAQLDTKALRAQLARMRALTRKNLPVNLVANVDHFMASIAAAKAAADRHMNNIRVGIEQTGFYNRVQQVASRGRSILDSAFRAVDAKVRVALGPLARSAQQGRQAVSEAFRGLRVAASWAGEKMMPAVTRTRNAVEKLFKGIRATGEWYGGPIIRQAIITRGRLQSVFDKVRADVELVTAPMMGAARAAKARAEAILRKVTARVEAKMDLDGNGIIAKARAYAKAASAGLKVNAKMDIDHRSLAGAMTGVQRSLRFMSRPFYKTFGGQVFQDVIQNFTRMKGAIASVTFAASALLVPLAAIGSAAGPSIASLVKLVGGMLPAAFGAAALGIAGIVKAFSGFGDVVKATNLEELEAALQGLGPAAQEGARGIYDMKTAFQEASAAAQENFWSGITESFSGLTTMAGMVGAAVADISTEAGKAANGFVEFTNTATGMAIFSKLLDESSRAASNIAKSVFNMVPGLMAVGAVAGEVFADLTEKMDQSLAGWSDRMVQDFESGALQQQIDQQVAEVQSLFSVIGDIGAIIGGVWNAAAESGERFLTPLRETVTKTREWVESSEGVNTLREYFDQMADVVETLAPIFSEIAQTIVGTVIPAMAEFILAAGPGMEQFASGFSSVIDQLSGLAGPLGEVFGSVVGSIGAILPSIAPLIPVVMGLWAAFEGGIRVAPILSAVGGVLGAVSAPMLLVAAGAAALAVGIAGVPGAAERLGGAFQGLLGALAPVGQMLMEFGQNVWNLLQPAFAALVPVIEQFINTVTQIVIAVTPVIQTILEFAQNLIGALVPVFVALMPVIQSFISIIGSIVAAVAPVLNIVLRVASAFLTLLANIVSFVATGLAKILSFVAGVIEGFASMVATVIGTVADWISSILSFIGDMASGVMSKVGEMWSQTVAKFTEGVSNAVSEVSQLPGKAKSAMGNLGSYLVSSGKALIQGFIDGIKSMISLVSDAASSVVQAARDFFPFSPAKRGPFSGRGYTTYSGKALVKDFAGGIRSEIGTAKDAANDLVEEVNRPFEELHHNRILQPVLESNAKKIHDSRKREAEAEEQHQKRLAEIQKEGGKTHEKIAKENEKHAERMAKIREDLDESLEAPDYSNIERSFKGFYVEGMRGLLEERLMQAVDSRNLMEKTRRGALEAVRQARATFGDHPIYAKVEANVNAKHFEYAFSKAIEESEISAVPVEFVISNLQQLKSDLGMGDGLVSRAIDQAAAWNWNNTDAKRFRDDKPYEVHYHVEDMQEAIRLENLRVRKQMMKMR